MFEAIVTLCLSLDPGICREQLIPGYESPSRRECAEALVQSDPQITVPPGITVTAAPDCRPVGKALTFEQVAPGVFVHVGLIAEPSKGNAGDVANVGFVIGEESVAVIDAGTARWMGEAIWRAIRAETNKPVSDVILTHMHPDHVLGATVLAEVGARVHGHANLARALADRSENYLQSLDRLIGSQALIGTQPPRVTDPVESQITIDLGQRVLVLRPWSFAHTSTDLTVLDQNTDTLFAGDLVFDRHTPALDGSLRGWLNVLTDMSGLPARQVVPGHGRAMLEWPQGAGNTQRYLQTLAEDTRAAVADGERLGEAVTHIAQDEASEWKLFEAYNPRNATVAFTELEWE